MPNDANQMLRILERIQISKVGIQAHKCGQLRNELNRNWDFWGLQKDFDR